MTSRAELAMDRAAERIVEDVAVSVEEQPTTSKTVQGLVGLVPVRVEDLEAAAVAPLWTFHVGDSGTATVGSAAGHVASGLSALWNLTAAAPRQISGPSLQELDDAADAMAAAVAAQLGRVAGFAARNLGGVTIASGLWAFQTGSPGPGTPRQAAVSPDDLAVIRDRWTVITDDVLGPKIAADYLAGAKGQHNRLAAALPPKVRRLAARPLADQAALLYAAGAANRLKGIGDELWAAARTALLEGMAKGESIEKLARRIRDATGIAIGRATTIARTESMGARSAGSYDEMLASGVVVSKTWQATGDLRTRPTHVIADGQTVPMAGKFTVGGWPADRPHDPMLPPEEAVNCRCTLTYGVDTDVATVVSAAEPAPPDLWIFHLPGLHDQSTHGRGGSSDFDARAANAVTGEAAHGSVAYDSGGDVDIDEAIEKYGGEGEASYFDVNRKLRDGGKMTPDQRHTKDGLDKAFADIEGAGSDMVVHRYMGDDLSGIFGGNAKDYWDNPPNLTGLSWRDKGFISTSAKAGDPSGGGTRMRILVPKGTKAISHGGLDPDEILLNRRLKLRVVADHGKTSGTHHMDIEVFE